MDFIKALPQGATFCVFESWYMTFMWRNEMYHIELEGIILHSPKYPGYVASDIVLYINKWTQAHAYTHTNINVKSF